ncbi:MAG TPA: NADH-quinone oxidoreductase subunit N [Thermoanaerobaculia bacterium]|nr:NADH-quinone oxidoreductase subunit N [Thermoanaerobaculia bacterium]
MTWTDTILLIPEIVLTIGACVLLLAPVLGMKEQSPAAKWVALAVLGATAAAVVYASNAGETIGGTGAFHRMFALDGFAIFFKLLFIGAVALVVLLSNEFLREEKYSHWEYYSLLAFALTGMMFMTSGIHLISIYIGLELLSLSSYILAGYYKDETKSTEAAMKYFVLGTVSSAILLYGLSLIYGVCGTLQLSEIRIALAGLVANDALVFGIVLLAAGLCFKVAAVPFHVWTPDVYVGAPTPVTAFLSTASKAAAFAIFARIFYSALPDFRLDWSALLAAISALSMIVGNLAAITQDNVKRMLAYSSIGHAGYALMGIIAMTPLGLHGVLVYMLVYVFATIGTWATVLMLRRHAYAGESVADFEGLHQRAPFHAFAMVVFLLSLGGIPPTAGFIGKYFLFAAAIQSGWGWLAIVAVLTSAISIFYYFRLVVAMYLREGKAAEVMTSAPLRFAIAICLAVTLGLGVLPQGLIAQVQSSSRTIVATLVP